jgi:hypothetical protein
VRAETGSWHDSRFLRLPEGSAVTREFITDLETRRAAAKDRCETILARAQAEGRDVLTPDEDTIVQDGLTTMRGLNQRIADLEADEHRRGDNNPVVKRIRAAQQTQTRSKTMSVHVSEPELYRRGGQYSFARDLIAASSPGLDLGGEARQRLSQHTEDMANRSGMEYRDISRVDGQGGYAVPPAWLVDMYVELARPGRAFANLCQRLPLPGGTDSINIPKVLSGTSVGIQTADNQPVSDTDITDTFINAPVVSQSS